MEKACPKCDSGATYSYLPIHDKINNVIKVSSICNDCGETWDSFFELSKLVTSEGEVTHFI